MTDTIQLSHQRKLRGEDIEEEERQTTPSPYVENPSKDKAQEPARPTRTNRGSIATTVKNKVT
jgi:hypothetical protein